MPIANFISTEGPYLKASIEIDGKCLCVMDVFSSDDKTFPSPGNEFEFEFGYLLGDDDFWEDVFSGNPDHRSEIEQISGWKYRAYGKVVSINPVVVDCGLLEVEDVISTHDPRVIGEFVAFTISRLECRG